MSGSALLCAFLFGLQLLSLVCAQSWPPKVTTGSEVGNLVGLGADVDFRVSAMGDWNNDDSIDLIGVGPDNSTLVIYYFTPANHSFGLTHMIDVIPDPVRPKSTNWVTNETIETISVADLNRDGFMDAVVTTNHNHVHLISGADMSVRHDIIPSVVDPKSVNLLVIFGRCSAVDILALTDDGLTIYKNGFNDNGVSCDAGKDKSRDFQFTVAVKISGGTGYSAAADFDGDCQGDLVVGVIDGGRVRYDIYTDGGDSVLKGEPTGSFSVPPTFGPTPSLGDYNGDGGFDFVFSTCSTLSNVTCDAPEDSLFFIFNDVSSLCGTYDCCKGHPWGFTSVWNQTEPLSDTLQAFRNLNMSCSRSSFALSEGVMRSLDWNNDALSDILLSSRSGPVLVVMGQLVTTECTQLATAEELDLDENEVVRPFFFDVLDDGRVDIMTTSSAGQGVRLLWNSLDTSEHFFFTATLLNGAQCDGTCWGGFQPGGTHRFQWTTIEQSTKTASGTQFTSSSHNALQFPRMHFGLDKTFGYIQNYAAGMRLLGGKDGKSGLTWPVYLVPNSQVLCTAIPLLSPAEWQIKLFFATIRYMTLIVASLAIALVVIGIPILVLKYREFRDDKKEKGYYAK